MIHISVKKTFYRLNKAENVDIEVKLLLIFFSKFGLKTGQAAVCRSKLGRVGLGQLGLGQASNSSRFGLSNSGHQLKSGQIKSGSIIFYMG